MKRRPTDKEVEELLGQVDKSGGLKMPSHSRAAIEAAEARAFGRRRRWRPSFTPKNR